MDWLWLIPFHIAYRKIMWAAQTNAPSVWIRLPFPFDDESAEWCERLHALWKKHGYGLRPGGPAGPAADIIRLDKDNPSGL